MDALFERLDGVKPAPGFSRVVVPGEPEAEQRLKRSREGFGVTAVIWEQIRKIAEESKVGLEDVLKEAGS